ncbi:MAG TPA: hypothetical protein VLX92_09085 [Kofleriaceae bacterium]|nr:hypothetical protein [Kofleriaceae bacterium]
MRIALLALGLTACSVGRADPPAPSDHDEMVRFHMHEHYTMLGAIEHLVIRDDLYDVQVIARVIAQALDEPGLARWQTDISFTRANARDLAMAPDSTEACRRTARLAATCANCHIDAHVTGMFGAPPRPPAEGTTTAARMARHVWAADRLYEGVIGGARDSWQAGLDVLAQTPAPDAKRAVLAQQLQDVAAAARKRIDQDDFAARARTYGDVLVTCLGCHAADRASAAGAGR